MILNDLNARHTALLAARYSGTRSVSYDGKSINYGSDAELAAAIADIERRIAQVVGNDLKPRIFAAEAGRRVREAVMP